MIKWNRTGIPTMHCLLFVLFGITDKLDLIQDDFWPEAEHTETAKSEGNC